MKKQWIAIFSIIIILLSPLLVSSTAIAAGTKNSEDWPDQPSVYAQSAIIMEASTGLVLYQKNINDEHYPASITKIMTVLLALENSSLGDTVTFSKNVVTNVERTSSIIFANEGEQMTMQQCLYAIMIESANDVAYGVAEHISGNIKEFAKLMNDKAKSLGCKNTHFVNPNGLPNEDHYTSAYDMALITREAMKYDTFRKIISTRYYELPPTNKQPKPRHWINHHYLVSHKNGYSYDGTIGGKTGYTHISKNTLVTAAKRGDMELICVVMKDNPQHQYTDTMKLFDYGFNNFSSYPIADLEKTDKLSESPMFTRYNSLLSETEKPISIDNNGYLVLPKTASFKEAKRKISFFSPNKNTSEKTTSVQMVSEANIIGKISYTYDGKYVGGANILYKNVNTPALIHNNTGSKNPASNSNASSHKSGGMLQAIIIGGIAGIVIIAIGLYYFLIERPRLKRRHAYDHKRALRRLRRDDDYLDL